MTATSLDKVFLDGKIDAHLVEDGIVENVIRSGVCVEPNLLWALKSKNQELTSGNKYCVLVVSEHLSDISKEARELVASKEYAMNTIAKALLVESTGHRLVGNFYISINKPVIKTKLFNDKTKAIEWLREQLNDSYNAV